MKFANRMDRFGEGVFSMLAQMKKKKLEEGEMIVDLSIGAPNIAPAPHILKALSEACLVPENYLYAIQDQQALLEAVSDWYARRYGVELNPETEICSLLGSQEGLAHIALSIVDEGDVVWYRIRVIRCLRMVRLWRGQSFTICRSAKKITTSLI